MKRIIKYAILAIIALVFVGTIVFLYRKSQGDPVVFTTDTTATMTIIRTNEGSIADVTSVLSGIFSVLHKWRGSNSRLMQIVGKMVPSATPLTPIRLASTRLSARFAAASARRTSTGTRSACRAW